jgi:hypothetical protein
MPKYYDTYERETLSTLNTRTGVKKVARNYSSYWMDFDDGGFDDAAGSRSLASIVESSDTERIVKLASVRRAVANFVRIITNSDKINVEFSSGKDSYTDGTNVVIAAEDDSKHFDSMVGLALHEGSHCLLSDFNINKNLLNRLEWWKFVLAAKPSLREVLGKNYNEGDITHDGKGAAAVRKQVHSMQGVIGMIMNIVEDRRIDSYVYKNAIGYRPYYDAMYTKYFFNSDIEKNMKHNPDWRKPTVENYINWLINIFHPQFDRNALPGLSQMVDMIDLKNIRRFDSDARLPDNFSDWKFSNTPAPWIEYWTEQKIPQYSEFARAANYTLDYDSLPLLWKVGNDIFETIIQYVANYGQEVQKQKGEGEGAGQSITIDVGGVEMEMDSNKLPNLDINQPTVQVKVGKFNDKKAKRAMDKMKQVMQRENRRKKLMQREKKDIELLEQADAKITEAGDNIVGQFPCLVTKKLTQQIMESNVFPFSRYDYITNGTRKLVKCDTTEAAVVKGVRMGQVLAHRLAVRNDPQITHFTRQEHGKIDRRILSQLGMDIENVFKRTTVDNYKPVMVHLSLDASGSMSGRKWEKCITVVTAMAYVSSKIQNVEVVITLRGDNEIPMVAVAYDSRRDTFQKVRSLFPYLRTNGSTPEGLCFKATLDLITECSGEYDVYFINFSDGEPGTSIRRKGEYNSYGGPMAYEHTRRQVQVMRDAGVKVLSYFISDYQDTSRIQYSSAYNPFKKMYGEDAVFINVQNVTEVLRTLNNLLIKKV